MELAKLVWDVPKLAVGEGKDFVLPAKLSQFFLKWKKIEEAYCTGLSKLVKEHDTLLGERRGEFGASGDAWVSLNGELLKHASAHASFKVGLEHVTSPEGVFAAAAERTTNARAFAAKVVTASKDKDKDGTGHLNVLPELSEYFTAETERQTALCQALVYVGVEHRAMTRVSLDASLVSLHSARASRANVSNFLQALVSAIATGKPCPFSRGSEATNKTGRKLRRPGQGDRLSTQDGDDSAWDTGDDDNDNDNDDEGVNDLNNNVPPNNNTRNNNRGRGRVNLTVASLALAPAGSSNPTQASHRQSVALRTLTEEKESIEEGNVGRRRMTTVSREVTNSSGNSADGPPRSPTNVGIPSSLAAQPQPQPHSPIAFAQISHRRLKEALASDDTKPSTESKNNDKGKEDSGGSWGHHQADQAWLSPSFGYSASAFVPWLPHPPLWAPSPSSWALTSFETLLLFNLQQANCKELPGLDTIRLHVGLTVDHFNRMKVSLEECALKYEKNGSPSSVGFRLFLLRYTTRDRFTMYSNDGATVPSDNTGKQKVRRKREVEGEGQDPYLRWFGRQLAVIMSSLQWHILNERNQSWRVRGKLRSSAKLLHSINEVADELWKRQSEALPSKPVSETRMSGLFDKFDNYIQAVCVSSASVSSEGPVRWSYPAQVVKNMYALLAWACYYLPDSLDDVDLGGESKNELNSQLLSLQGMVLIQEEFSNKKEKEKEERLSFELPRVHSHMDAVLRSLFPFHTTLVLSPVHHHLVMMHILASVVEVQSWLCDQPPLNTPAVTNHTGAILGTFAGHLQQLETHLTASNEQRGATEDIGWVEFGRRGVQHLVLRWLEDYHDAQPSVVEVGAGLVARIMDLLAVHARGVERALGEGTAKAFQFELVFLREKKIAKVLAKSAHAHCRRLRDSFDKKPGEFTEEEWSEFAVEMVETIHRESNQFANALGIVHRNPHDITLPILATHFRQDVRELVSRTKLTDRPLLSILPHVKAVIDGFADITRKHTFAAQHASIIKLVPSMYEVSVWLMDGWLQKQFAKVSKWVIRSVAQDGWTPVTGGTKAVDGPARRRLASSPVVASTSVLDLVEFTNSLLDVAKEEEKKVEKIAGEAAKKQSRLLLVAHLRGLLTGYAGLVTASCGAHPVTITKDSDFVKAALSELPTQNKDLATKVVAVFSTKRVLDPVPPPTGRPASPSISSPLTATSLTTLLGRSVAQLVTSETLTTLCVRLANLRFLLNTAITLFQELGFLDTSQPTSCDCVDELRTEEHRMLDLLCWRVLAVEWTNFAGVYKPTPSVAPFSALRPAVDETMKAIYPSIGDSYFSIVVSAILRALSIELLAKLLSLLPTSPNPIPMLCEPSFRVAYHDGAEWDSVKSILDSLGPLLCSSLASADLGSIKADMDGLKTAFGGEEGGGVNEKAVRDALRPLSIPLKSATNAAKFHIA